MPETNEYDPNAVYKEPIYTQEELSKAPGQLRDIGNGVNSSPVGITHIGREELEQCCIPDDGMSSEQRETVQEWQARMGVGMERMRGNNRGRTYHYFR